MDPKSQTYPPQAKVCHMENLWQQDTSAETSELLLAGWSKGTKAACQSGWNDGVAGVREEKLILFLAEYNHSQTSLHHCFRKVFRIR